VSGSCLGKGSRHGGSIAPLAQAGVLFHFIFYFFTNRLLLLQYRTVPVCEQATYSTITLGIVGKILVNTG